MDNKEEINRNTYRTQTVNSKKTKEKEKRRKNLLFVLLVAGILALVFVIIVIVRTTDWNKTESPQDNKEIITNPVSETISLPEIYKNNEIIGTWLYDEYNQYTFNSDGTGYLMADDVRYDYSFSLDNGKLVLDFYKDIVKDCEYEYSITASELSIIGGNGTDGGSYSLSKIR